jgi:hypothetical protein
LLADSDDGARRAVMNGNKTNAADIEWHEALRAAPPSDFDIGAAAVKAVRPLVEERIQPGARVGVLAGSRGIAGVADAIAAVVDVLREHDAKPVLIPAMGSHGGATPAGQIHVLHELGVDEDRLGVPIEASMEVAQLGEVAGGFPVFIARAALDCDVVIPVNRVKPHSDFRAPIESGLTKMLSIGIGKEAGASSLHRAGFERFGEVLPAAARIVLDAVRVPFGVALLEDLWHRPRRLEAVAGERIIERDAELLAESREHLGLLPFSQLDVLIVRETGKNISGAGMDPNVTGRLAGPPFPTSITVGRLAVLDLTEESGGNAIGFGVADFITERLRDKIDWPATYANALASKSPLSAKMPFVAESDAAAIDLSAATLIRTSSAPLRIAAIRNTLDVNHVAVTASLAEEARAAGYTVTDAGRAEFDRHGTLARIGGLEFFPQEAE